MVMLKIYVINGPNLNLLGHREPERYGRESLEDINESLRQLGKELGLEVDFFQSNHEGDLVGALQKVNAEYDGALLNAAAYTHTSIALRDAVLAIDKPVIEVHLTNPVAREGFRKKSFLSGVAVGVVAGFGARSYELALRWFSGREAAKQASKSTGQKAPKLASKSAGQKAPKQAPKSAGQKAPKLAPKMPGKGEK
jgi:3-dehydroquinate dehydratase-2